MTKTRMTIEFISLVFVFSCISNISMAEKFEVNPGDLYKAVFNSLAEYKTYGANFTSVNIKSMPSLRECLVQSQGRLAPIANRNTKRCSYETNINRLNQCNKNNQELYALQWVESFLNAMSGTPWLSTVVARQQAIVEAKLGPRFVQLGAIEKAGYISQLVYCSI